MPIETTIREMLEKRKLAEQATLPASNIGSGDKTPPKQGDSKDADYQELDKDISGASAAAPIEAGADQKTIVMKGDAKTVKTQAQEDFTQEGETLEEAFTRKHFVAIADALKEITDHSTRLKMAQHHINIFKRDNPRFDEARFRKAANAELNQDVKEGVEAADLKADIAALFEGQEVAEEFVTKATSIFEAAVVARVNSEVEKVSAELQEQTAADIAAAKTSLEEDVDLYLSYVVENWLKENKVAVDAGLRTEVAEGFITGLKNLFVEHYIEVPEDKVDVLESLSTDLDATKSRLNEEIENSIALKNKIVELEKQAVLEAVSKDMVATDAERLVKLVEGVEFENKELFSEKVAVIKEAHFKQPAKKSAEKVLAEQAGDGNTEKVITESVQRYVAALNRNTRF